MNYGVVEFTSFATPPDVLLSNEGSEEWMDIIWIEVWRSGRRLDG